MSKIAVDSIESVSQLQVTVNNVLHAKNTPSGSPERVLTLTDLQAAVGITRGYNITRASFLGAVLSLEGSVEVNGKVISQINYSSTITGLTGWRYLCVSNTGVFSIELVPIGEIILNVPVNTPTPIFDILLYGYYSSANPTLRIIKTFYFDGVNILDIEQYGNGREKSNSYYTGSVPIGTELFVDLNNPLTPTLGTDWVRENGQLIQDGNSPYNGRRIRNLNGSTVSSIPITAVDDVLKTITVSLNDIYALMIGDSLSFIGAVVVNAVVRSVNYTTGVIEVGDVTLWSSGQFDLTTSTLTGAITLFSVGLKRFAKGDLLNSGGGVNTLQGFKVFENAYDGVITTGINYLGGVTPSGIGTSVYGTITTDSINGTPRTGSETTPNYFNGVWIKKIK